MPTRLRRAVLNIAVAVCTIGGVSAGARADGLQDLIDRLGAGNVPTGAGVSVGQVEVPDTEGDYGPNQGHEQYDGVTFHEECGSTGTSPHANSVARRFYGNVSIAMGIDDVWLWGVNCWFNAYLRAGTSFEPVNPPGGVRIFNHSWIGTTQNNAIDNEILRRTDYIAMRDDLLFVVGVGNAADDNVPLMSHLYNGISAGLLDGTHLASATSGAVDGPGRLKPEMVVDVNLTSYAAAKVSGAASLMIETARTTPTLGINPNAERAVVVKSVLLAGAQKTPSWTNNPSVSGADRGITTQPIDTVYGAGQLDVNLAHLILTGGEQDGTLTVPGAANISHTGWDLTHLETGESAYYRFRVEREADAISIVATWPRRVNAAFTIWNMADYNLRLHRIDATGQLHPLTGNDGVGYFAGGNVVSASTVDNIEHLYITGLAPCEYVLELSRDDTLPGNPQRDVAVSWRMPAPPACPADLDDQGGVDVFDLFELLGAWGPCADDCLPACLADLNADGTVDVFDLFILLNAWGPCTG